jgi:hypothetical protein
VAIADLLPRKKYVVGLGARPGRAGSIGRDTLMLYRVKRLWQPRSVTISRRHHSSLKESNCRKVRIFIKETEKSADKKWVEDGDSSLSVLQSGEDGKNLHF